MRFGFHFVDLNLPAGPASYAPALRATAVAAEDIGASWFTVMDHYFQMEQFRTAHDPMLEGYTTLGFLAASTSRIHLGRVVTGVTYRHPGHPRQDRHDPRRPQRGARVPRHRGDLVRA